MLLADLHKEDVKAAIRKRFGSVAAFEREKSLPEKSVTDVLRGYRSERVERAVIDAISSPMPLQSEGSGDSADKSPAHRLNGEVR